MTSQGLISHLTSCKLYRNTAHYCLREVPLRSSELYCGKVVKTKDEKFLRVLRKRRQLT